MIVAKPLCFVNLDWLAVLTGRTQCVLDPLPKVEWLPLIASVLREKKARAECESVILFRAIAGTASPRNDQE